MKSWRDERPEALGTSAGLWFGGDYNPEQWPREVWDEDVELMKRAGVNSVSLGIFSWSLLEPVEGEYSFGWLDDAIELLSSAGIGVGLATPTASPPPWFTLAHRDAMPVTADGVGLVHGSRDTYCLAAPAYREASRRIARALAERYGRHPAVRYWHVHNEYGTLCWCDHAAEAFRTWLRSKYGTLDALNEAWLTSFWSQRYTSWDQIMPPRRTQYLHNPTHAIDFRRFSSDELLACLAEQRDAIAAASDAPITTNFMLPTWNNLEQWSWSAEQDFVSMDHYLDTDGPDGEAFVAYAADLTRSWAGRRPWLMMESACGSINVGDVWVDKPTDRMIRDSLSYVARGAAGVQFFQWRASRAGSEAWHPGLVPHAGADSDMYRGVVQLGEALAAIGDVAVAPATGPVLDADVAIWWHADGWWALENGGLPSTWLDYSARVRAAHRSLWRAGVTCDFVHPEADLDGYRLLLVPAMATVSEAAARVVERFVQSGGRVVVFPFSGVMDPDAHIILGGYPGAFRDVLGVRVEQMRPLREGTAPLSNGMAATDWTELVRLAGAEPVVTYADGALAGLPAITRRAVGSGCAVYVSVGLAQEDLDALIAGECEAAGVTPVVAGLPAGVEAVRRRGADADYLFVLNHSEASVRLAGQGRDLLTNADADGLVIAPGDAAVLAESARDWTICPS